MKFRIFLGNDIGDVDYLNYQQNINMQITIHALVSQIVKTIF